jgi:hypothetical protein
MPPGDDPRVELLYGSKIDYLICVTLGDGTMGKIVMYCTFSSCMMLCTEHYC